MKSLVILIFTFFVATSSFAAEISETDVKTFLADWLAAQNSGSYPKYASMYSKTFFGLRRSGERTFRFDHDTWLKDREKMFKKKMIVKAINPHFQISVHTASIRFVQDWESGTYKDRGDKLIELVLEDRNLKIEREELLNSNISSNGNSHSRKINEHPIPTSSNIEKIDYCFISKITSIKQKDCKKIPPKISARFDNRDLERSECSAPKGWRVFTVIGGERSWIEIANGTSVWSTEDEVITKGENRFGEFQSVDFELLEWRITKKGEIKSLILPVVAQDPERIGRNIYRYFVIKIVANTPFFCGVAKSKHTARDIADTSAPCNIALPRRTIWQR